VKVNPTIGAGFKQVYTVRGKHHKMLKGMQQHSSISELVNTLQLF